MSSWTRWPGRSKLLSRVDALDTFHQAMSDVLTLLLLLLFEVSSDASYAADAASAEAVLVSLALVLLLLRRTRQKSIVSSGLNTLTRTCAKYVAW